ncbi:MAG: hypothetical protein ACT4NX_04325 [Deltaproteobacteria bacterium]
MNYGDGGFFSSDAPDAQSPPLLISTPPRAPNSSRPAAQIEPLPAESSHPKKGKTSVAWAYIIRTQERELFKRCRRAWNFQSGERGNFEPVGTSRALDFQRAISDALAVYYFPGMWEWNRRIVLPLVIEGFYKSMRNQRDKFGGGGMESPDHEAQLAFGELMLNRYFEWAASVDDFSPIQVEPDFEVNIPDPARPGQDLVVPGAIPVLPIRYRGRVNLLAVDEYNAYWIIKHRVVEGAWEYAENLLLDERELSHCWALESYFPGMKIAGVVYNELRKDSSPSGGQIPSNPSNFPNKPNPAPKASPSRRIYLQAIREPDFTMKQTFCGDSFRRTHVPRSRAAIENFGRQIVMEAMEMANPEVRIYPSPSRENCSTCAFVKPCIAMNEGQDASPQLSEFYRKSMGDSEFEPGRLGGSTFSLDRGGMPPDKARR